MSTLSGEPAEQALASQGPLAGRLIFEAANLCLCCLPSQPETRLVSKLVRNVPFVSSLEVSPFDLGLFGFVVRCWPGPQRSPKGAAFRAERRTGPTTAGLRAYTAGTFASSARPARRPTKSKGVPAGRDAFGASTGKFLALTSACPLPSARRSSYAPRRQTKRSLPPPAAPTKSCGGTGAGSSSCACPGNP